MEIKKYENNNSEFFKIFEMVKNLNTPKERFIFFLKDTLIPILLISIITFGLGSFILNILNSIIENNFNFIKIILNVIITILITTIFVYFISYVYVLLSKNTFDLDKYDDFVNCDYLFLFKYIKQSKYNQYINKFERTLEKQKNKIYSNYNILFFKLNDNNEFEIKHLVDFIKNREFNIKKINDNEIDLDLKLNGYHKINTNNLEKFGHLNSTKKRNAFKENIESYYLTINEIKVIIDQLFEEQEIISKENEYKAFLEAEAFRKSLKIKKGK